MKSWAQKFAEEKILITIMMVSIFVLYGCSNTRDLSGTSKLSQSIFPHTENWKSNHVGILASQSERAADVAQNLCISCHAMANVNSVSFLGNRLDCGSSCHITDGAETLDSLLHESAVIEVKNDCSNCHDLKSTPHISFHFPTAAGLCSTCHQASREHISGASKGGVTTLSGETSCLNCHTTDLHLDHQHQPMFSEQACSTCHEPHYSNQVHLLKQNSFTLCQSCHDLGIQNAVTIHGPINSQNSCTTCHEPHGTGIAALLHESSRDTCLDCHDHEVASANGTARIIPEMKSRIANARFVHEPVTDSCVTCHDPHASAEERLLKAAYPSDSSNERQMFQKFSEKLGAFALCFTCHNSNILNQTFDNADTQFRIDQIGWTPAHENLHWLHIVQGGLDSSNGIACAVCHDSHLSELPHGLKSTTLVRDRSGAVSVGELGFIANPNDTHGGSCANICHEGQSYSYPVLVH